MKPGSTDRFFSSTRGRIILHLMESRHTVNELAERLGLTDNAVRTHLVALERDGYIRQCGERRSGGRPAYIYEVTAAADDLFPKAYREGLGRLVRALSDRMDGDELRALLSESGRAAVEPSGADDLEGRIEEVLEALRDRGAIPSAEREGEDGDDVVVRSACCVLSGLVEEQRACCHFVRGMVEGVVGTGAEVCCEFGERPQCCFRVETGKDRPEEG